MTSSVSTKSFWVPQGCPYVTVCNILKASHDFGSSIPCMGDRSPEKTHKVSAT
eukprot:CAMPEP_0174325854 /NCGR_PEP_ID=MMETSP0810-20121108/13523_1 /TAXON_ID=73025 ORGANISM="Eutreptiella gymnastica-like, Strain CCMP1594" /NCGR_SAMPLE_ID=MMETSP0810 /ASSEMBLY_ACC=CAM_ASM_000659 /LENGTH=52 /DNA_ID=CAMNT_0015439297 /DNA_START=1135 /DNA_END=1289 /DNA_ORIENTATION=+